jgi:branched-chain amino acid transport system substrate-binding protein
MPSEVSKSKRRYIYAALSAAATVPLVLAGCSSSGGGGNSNSSAPPATSGGASSVAPVSSAPVSSAAAGDATLGTPNKATGSPITIGISNPGKTAAVDTTDENTAAKAAVAYANDYLGGINGHVIKVKECSTQDSPAGESDCANQMIQANVAATTQASGDDVTIKAMAKAGILDFMNVGASPVALGTPGAYSMANPLAVYGVPAAYAKQIGTKSAALLVIDVPGASGPAKQLGPLFFGNAGVALNVVTIAQGTADMTPQVQATLSKKPGLYYILGDSTFATSAIKAVKTLAPNAKISMYYTGISAKPTNIPGGYAGIQTVATQVLDPKSAEYKLYVAIQKKYNGATSAIATSGYAPVLGLIRALNAAKLTDTSAKGVLAALAAAPAVPLPLGGGATFQCNGKAVSISPFICSAAGAIADTAADGTLSNFRSLGDATIYAKP